MKSEIANLRKKSQTKLSKIIFPFSEFTELLQKGKTHKSLLQEEKNKHSQKSFNNQQQKFKNKSQSSTKKIRAISFTKLISSFEKQLISEKDSFKDNRIYQSNKKSVFLTDNSKQLKHRSLSKSRSVGGINFHLQSEEQPSLFKRVKKERSLTKLEAEWLKGRAVEKQKENEKVHKFDQEKIDRDYNHLGKLRKATIHKETINSKFNSFKNFSRQIQQIDISAFEQANKDFNGKFRQANISREQNSLLSQNWIDENQQKTKKELNPTMGMKNFLKMNSNNFYNKSKGSNKQQNIRISADEQFFRSKNSIELNQNNDIQNDSFFSEIKKRTENLLNVPNELGQDNSQQEFQIDPNIFAQAGISENLETQIIDKIYFFSSKLSSRIESLFTIEKINLKAKSEGNLIVQVVISSNEQILVQRIVYERKKKCQTFKKLKPIVQGGRNQQKDRLKHKIFSQLILKRLNDKNRQSSPDSIRLNSEKDFFLKSSELIQLCQNLYQFSENISLGLKGNVDAVNEKAGSQTIVSKVTIECYQAIVEYIQRFYKLQVSYIGASLKQTESLMHQVMEEKHYQMQQSLRQSLKLAQSFYFLIKINATYYVSKTVIISHKRIKHYLLYEFSNKIQNEKGCIIQEEEDMDGTPFTMRKNQLVKWLHCLVNKFFTKMVSTKWKQNSENNQGNYKTTSDKDHNTQNDDFPLINALKICFGTLGNLGIQCQQNLHSQRLYKIVQSNYKNDIRWQKIDYQLSPNIIHNNFFQFHNSFDLELFNEKKTHSNNQKQYHRQSRISKDFSVNKIGGQRVLFSSSLIESQWYSECTYKTDIFSYVVTRNFQIMISLYSSAVKSRHQIVRLHPTKIRDFKLQDQFRRQQFALLHMQDQKVSHILNGFLRKQYINRIIKTTRHLSQSKTKQQPFFTMIKSNKYYVNVFIPLFQQPNSCIGKKQNLIKQMIYIQIQGRLSLKRYSVQTTLGELFDEMKEYHRLFSDSRSYRQYTNVVERMKRQLYSMSKEFLVDLLKLYVDKLQLVRKNTYSRFYFIPLCNLVNMTSQKSFLKQTSQNNEQKIGTDSSLPTQSHFRLIFQALQKLQPSLKIQQKHSSSLTNIKIRNFPIYQISHKSTRKLFPGHYVIISIYYLPLFDLSEIKLYVTKLKKNFFMSIKKSLEPHQYENLVMVLVQFLKDRFFHKVIKSEAQKLSSKYKDFYSRMLKQAQNPFLIKNRKRQPLSQHSITYNKRNKNSTHSINLNRHYTISQVQFTQLTQQLLFKVFQSQHRQNKYIIRLSYPSTTEYIAQSQRKGIDEIINISVVKQNCMLIYKFQTTVRKLLAKKGTHKMNSMQQYQQKSKPFSILFQQIKSLIEQSDESTYGLLNTFKTYFNKKNLNTLNTPSLVSILSINLLAGISQNMLTSDNFLRTTNNNSYAPQNFTSQRELNLKDLNTNIYQRYCLFVQHNQMLEVLKIRHKNKISSLSTLNKSIPSSNTQQKEENNNLIKRRGQRKQSIEAFLVEDKDFHKTLNTYKEPKIHKKYIKEDSSFNQFEKSQHFDFIVENTYLINEHQPQIKEEQSGLEQKVVHLINTETQEIQEIMSSENDQGFTMNVPLGKYNKKMFKRFFKHLIVSQEQKPLICESQTNTYQNSVLLIPDTQYNSLNTSRYSSIHAFK